MFHPLANVGSIGGGQVIGTHDGRVLFGSKFHSKFSWHVKVKFFDGSSDSNW